ncbi:hypothetical protein KR032_003002 [Drosophila birchii]|nr:hypothetical protein KR032_003002 [Drosophila birchii]
MYTKTEIEAKKPRINNNIRKPRTYINKTPKNKASIRQTELAEKRLKKKKADRRPTKIEKTLDLPEENCSSEDGEVKEPQGGNKAWIQQTALLEKPLKYKKKLTSKKRTPKKTLASKPQPEESSEECASDKEEVNEQQNNQVRNTLPENNQVNWLDWLTMKEVCQPPKPLIDFKIKLSPYPYPALDEGANLQSTLRKGLSVKRYPNKITVRYKPDVLIQENLMPQQVLRNVPIPVLNSENDYFGHESFQKDSKIGFSPETNQNDPDTNYQEDLVSQRINRFDGKSDYLSREDDISVYIPQQEVPAAALNITPKPIMMHHKPMPFINNIPSTEQHPKHFEPQSLSRDIDSDISIGNHNVCTPLKVKLNPKYKTKAARSPIKHKETLKKKPKPVLKQKAGLKLKKKTPIRKVKGKKHIGKRSMEAMHQPPSRWWLSRWIWPNATDLDN